MASSVLASSRLGLQPCPLRRGRGAFGAPIPARGAAVDARRCRTQAYVEPSVSFAVTQQALAYAVVLAAEGFYTRSQLSEGEPGRPDLLVVGAGTAGTLLAVGLCASGSDALYTPAFIVGMLASGGMLAYNAKRTNDTKQDGLEWPGPKTWPATMTLISFFALNAFLQGIRAEL